MAPVIGEFNINLDDHEITRRAYVADAIPGWTEVEIRADEVRAYKMLYSGLDDKQQETYDMLVEQGVIPGGL